jgi:CheY-like chemotaxis protein
MSETATPIIDTAAVQAPTVYFIDDSATMREVIKIAFRKENIHVVACHDAASAIAQMEQTSPDVVISDVIMPDKDGYEVCQHIKLHSRLGKTPVILMSGVVNRAVADKALAVKADELIRKPFQPQELIARVKHLLKPQGAVSAATPAASGSAHAWGSVFGASAPKAVAQPAPRPAAAPDPRPAPVPATVPPRAAAPQAAAPVAPRAADAPPSAAMLKLRAEVQRLDQLVKKLRSELDAERQYCRALEDNIKTLQETDA